MRRDFVAHLLETRPSVIDLVQRNVVSFLGERLGEREVLIGDTKVRFESRHASGVVSRTAAKTEALSHSSMR